MLGQPALRRGQRQGHEIALQAGQHHLRLGVAETGVELDGLYTFVSQHQAGIEDAAKLVARTFQLAQRRAHDALDNHVDQRVIGPLGRRVRAHASGVGAAVTVLGALVVAGGREGDEVGAVGHAVDRELRTLEPFLDHDRGPAPSETLLDEHCVDRLVGFLDARAHDHALAPSKAVGFDRDLSIVLACPPFRRRGQAEHVVVRRRNAGALHQALGESLARLDAPGASVRPENGEARVAKRVTRAGVDSGLRAEDNKAEPFALRKVNQPNHVRRSDGDISRHAPGAAVAGRAVDALDEIGLHAFPDECVLTRARANDQDLHRFRSICAKSSGKVVRKRTFWPKRAECGASTPTRWCRAVSM